MTPLFHASGPLIQESHRESILNLPPLSATLLGSSPTAYKEPSHLLIHTIVSLRSSNLLILIAILQPPKPCLSHPAPRLQHRKRGRQLRRRQTPPRRTPNRLPRQRHFLQLRILLPQSSKHQFLGTNFIRTSLRPWTPPILLHKHHYLRKTPRTSTRYSMASTILGFYKTLNLKQTTRRYLHPTPRPRRNQNPLPQIKSLPPRQAHRRRKPRNAPHPPLQPLFSSPANILPPQTKQKSPLLPHLHTFTRTGMS